MNIGTVLREQREFLRLHSKSFSLRQVALRVGIEPAYLSKIERGETAPPSEATLKKIAHELQLDPDVVWPCQGKYRRIYRKLSAHVRCSFPSC